MDSLKKTFSFSVGRKYLMALTGLFLSLFLVEHLYGNLLLYCDDAGAAFVEYSHTMVHSILIRIVEVVLFLAIAIHAIQALLLTLRNKKARPVGYAVNKPSANSNWYSRNMGLTGSIILFFLVVHLNNFFVPYRITGLEADENVAMEVKEAFESVWYCLLYVVATIILGFHLNHGFASSFQTLGLNNKGYGKLIKCIGTGFAILITLGFISFPILFHFNLVGHTIVLAH
jgi:succinate dehydrogenase / fumarate reductase cytochrome b subunit